MFALIRFEIRKLASQRRSLTALLVVVLMNVLFTIAFLMRYQSRGGKPVPGLEGRLGAEFLNGMMYAQSILAPCIFMLFPMIVSIVGCHILASEIEVGSIRLMACRRVSRWQILIAKFVALCGYSGLLMLALLCVSYACGAFFFDPQGDVVIIGHMWTFDKGVFLLPQEIAGQRLLLSYLFSWPLLMSVSAMSLLFSLVTRHFTSASILTTTVYFCSYIVCGIPFLSAIHPFLPTRHMPFFRFALLPQIPWDRIGTHAFWTFGYTALFLGLAIAIFNVQEL
ncbi:MAG: ABC transporter permease subunit [Lentisphaeria bacterium]|nr:ABC transporter permease subunit [Lentisphaeria bacterium]